MYYKKKSNDNKKKPSHNKKKPTKEEKKENFAYRNVDVSTLVDASESNISQYLIIAGLIFVLLYVGYNRYSLVTLLSVSAIVGFILFYPFKGIFKNEVKHKIRRKERRVENYPDGFVPHAGLYDPWTDKVVLVERTHC